jgi:hypothetical protein
VICPLATARLELDFDQFQAEEVGPACLVRMPLTMPLPFLDSDSRSARDLLLSLPGLRGDAYLVRGHEEVAMSATIHGAPTLPLATPTSKTRERVRKILLACGPLSALVYIGWRELAALQWEGYSRISNSISELQLTGTPTKALLDPWEGWVYSALSLAFGSVSGYRPEAAVRSAWSARS